MKNPVSFLRATGLIEAVSFLILVGVAMPLKYIWHEPLAVKIVGWIHGILFMIFCLALLRTLIVARWPFGRAILIFIAALLPFGPFVVDRKMRQYEKEFSR